MSIRYAVVQIARDERTVLRVSVVPWEVPLLAAVNGEQETTIVGEEASSKRFPDAQSEYERLTLKYKRNNESGQDYVAAVYGVGQRGIAAIQSEIDKAKRVSDTFGETGDLGHATDEDEAGLEQLLGASSVAGGATPVDQ